MQSLSQTKTSPAATFNCAWADGLGRDRREEDIASLSYVAHRGETAFVVAQAVYPVLRQTVEGGIGESGSDGRSPSFGDKVLATAAGHFSHKDRA